MTALSFYSALGVLAVSASTLSAQSVIYRETFSNTVDQSNLSTAGWNLHFTSGTGANTRVVAASTTGTSSVYGLSGLTGSPVGLDNVASSPTTAGLPTGFAYVNTTQPSSSPAFLLWTSEFTIDRDLYSALNFRFWTGNNSAAASIRIAVRVGSGSESAWFASDSTASSSAVVGGQNFAANAEEKNFSFSAIGSTWRSIENAEASSTTGRTLSLPSSLTYALPEGNITAFGWFIDPNGGGMVRLDTLEVTAIPEPSAIGALAGLGVIGFVAARRRRRA